MAKAPSKTNVKAAVEEVENDDAKAVDKTKADIVLYAYDNEHKDGIHCTLTFQDGSTSIGVAPSTGDLAHDQDIAYGSALASAA
jgi:hypothetical protein